MSAHWDGDDLLYVVEAGGSNLELYIEKLGYMFQAGTNWTTTIYDRDQSGTAVNRHGGTNSASSYAWFTQLALDNIHPYGSGHVKCTGSVTLGNFQCNGFATTPLVATAGGASCAIPPSNSNECGAGTPGTTPAILDAARDDGYYDGTVAIQGVRAYDPNMNQWTTPDAYSGDVHDPMSQHPYMWNDNNPVEYEDPTGYCLEDACVVEGGVTIGATEAAVAVIFVVGQASGSKQITNTAASLQGKINDTVKGVGSAVMRALRGAASPPGDPNGRKPSWKKLSNSEAKSVAKNMGYDDVHAMKEDTLGTDKNLSKSDVYVDKNTGDYYVMGKGGTGEPQQITPSNASTSGGGTR
jgi:RHS repeat-associated protein